MKEQKQGVVGKAISPIQLMEEVKRRAEERRALIARMTPEELAAFEKEEAKKSADADKLVRQLMGPGFSALFIKS